MRLLLAFVALQSGLFAITPTQLDVWKKQFPPHVAGPMSETTDPQIALLYFRYKYNVGRMNIDAVESQFEALRDEMKSDLARIDLDRYSGNAASYAAKQNEAWLKTKVRPWLMKLEAMLVAPSR